MNDDYLGNVAKRIALPTRFHSVEKARPFGNCVDCELELTGSGVPYLIEKALRGAETVYEFALCMTCRDKLESSLSKESLSRIEDMYRSQMGRMYHRYFRLRRLLQEDSLRSLPDGLDPWLSSCAVTGRSVTPKDERIEIALCQGSELLLGDFPMMISESTMETMMELLSKASRDELDRWRDEKLSPSPEWQELLGGPRVFVM